MQIKKHHAKSIAIWAITPNGKTLGQLLNKQLCTSKLFISKKMRGSDPQSDQVHFFTSLSDKICELFTQYRGHIFIFSTGIAVRIIAPLLVSKLSDPAVVVIDDNGHHAISLLSGHMGGANALANQVAEIIGGEAVITTATDTNRLPSIDMIAKSANLFIETPENIKHVNMAFLQGKATSLQDSTNCLGSLLSKNFQTPFDKNKPAAAHIFCSYYTDTVSRETLILRPQTLCVGIGCNRGTSHKEIKHFLLKTMSEKNLSVHSIYRLATSDIKKDEHGLTALSKDMGIPIEYYDKMALNSVKTIKNPSKMALKYLGVNSVCEAAAILTANNGELIVPKKKNKDVTIAVAVKI